MLNQVTWLNANLGIQTPRCWVINIHVSIYTDIWDLTQNLEYPAPPTKSTSSIVKTFNQLGWILGSIYCWALVCIIHFKIIINKFDVQISLQHVDYESVHPAHGDQVPGQAPKVPRGAQKIIFAMLLQVLVGRRVSLHREGFMMFRIIVLFLWIRVFVFLHCVKIGCVCNWYMQSIYMNKELPLTLMYSEESGSNWTRHRFNTSSWRSSVNTLWPTERRTECRVES